MEPCCHAAPSSSTSTSSLYATLGVAIGASQDTLRRAYLALAKVYHPDRHNGCYAAMRKFQEIAAAFEVLSDSRQRQQYDLSLLHHLDVESYLARYECLILTSCGLGMTLGSSSSPAWQQHDGDAVLMLTGPGPTAAAAADASRCHHCPPCRMLRA